MTSRKNARAFRRATAAIALSSALAACAGWVPGRQSYWDAKVKEMCKKDGGVTIYERVRVTQADINILGHVNGMISVPAKELAPNNAPVYSQRETTYLNAETPRVWRDETEVVRRADGKVVARIVSYSRVGGDFPSPAHESSLTCPEPRRIARDRQRLFIVEGGAK